MSEAKRPTLSVIHAAASRINRLYSQWAARQGVNHITLSFLCELKCSGSITQRRFCELYDIPKQTVNNVITALKRGGYITMQASRLDKREKLIVLTHEGEVYTDELLLPLVKIESAVVSRMSESRTEQLMHSMISAGEILEQEMDRAYNTQLASRRDGEENEVV